MNAPLRPYTLVAELTYRCPLRCVYCSNPVDFHRSRTELSTGEWRRVFSEAAELGVVQLFAVGKMAPVTARGAREAGLNRVFEFADVETAAVAIKSFLKNGDVLLVKASRAARLERIGEMLRSGEAARKN